MAKKKRGGGVNKVEPPDESVDAAVLASALAVEFPLIDPSLIHALLLDYDPDALARHVDDIRDQLGILEATSVPDMDQSTLAAPGSPEMTPSHDTYETDASGPVLSFHLSARSTTHGTVSTPASTSPPSTCSDRDDPQTEQELLATFFPGLSQKIIDEALSQEPSLDAAIDHLLSVELIKGVQRTGVWPDEPPEQETEEDMTVIVRRPRGSGDSTRRNGSEPGRPRTKKAPSVTIPLVDTLQRRAAPVRSASASVSGSSTPRTPVVTSSDVWSAFASLAAFLSDVLPRAQTSFYTSYLHSPDYSCAHEAVLAALANLASSSRIDALPKEAISVVEDIYGYSLQDEAAHDLELCLRAAEGDVGIVMDLMDLLTELTWWPDYEAVKEMGRDPFEQLAELEKALPPRRRPTPQSQTTTPPTTTRAQNSNRLQRPKSEEPKKRDRIVPGSRPVASGFTPAYSFSITPSGRGSTTAPTKKTISWQEVATARRQPRRNAHPLATSIPAYGRGMLPQDQRPGALAAAQNFESGTGGRTAADCYAQSNIEWKRREEAIRSAGRHFKAGGRKNASASVAAHYAAQARTAGAAAREWELRGARMVVDAQMGRTGHTVDLHYATVDQAVTLALESAHKWWNGFAPGDTPTHPLMIVTGKGHHSAGQRGVLGPAVSKALSDDGWRVEKCEGYVVVKGVK